MLCFIIITIISSVTYIEGTASKLIEDKGIVVGVQYREKESDKLKVRTHI